jgi:hypothetical protein
VSSGDALLELPFDQYQRYQVASALLLSLGLASDTRVVDVGGAPGFVEDFLPGCETVVVDVEGTHNGRLVYASGARLPFGDAMFDAVLALDTLEHVPPEMRDAFLEELRRVGDVVILSAPFADPNVELAETALMEFVNVRLGVEFPTLAEHSTNGLPDLSATVKAFDADGWATATLPSGYLPRWLGAMLVHHELLASGVGELSKLHAYYNATVSPFDCREPAYRHVVLAARELALDVLADATSALQVEGDTKQGEAALNSIASAVFASRLARLATTDDAHREIERCREEIDRLRGELQAAERVVADRDAHLIDSRARIDDLERDLAAARRTLTNRTFDVLAQWRQGRGSK